MKNFLLLIAFVGLNTIALFAQAPAAPDFSGTWVLDEKSTFTRDVDKAAFKDYVMEISEDNEAFLIHVSFVRSDRSISYKLRLYKDGRGEENSLSSGLRQASTTIVKDRQMIRKYKYNTKPAFGGTDEYKLSKNGQKLVYENRRSSLDKSPWEDMPVIREQLPPRLPSTLVFRRKS